MRWQLYGVFKTEGMYEDLSAYPIEKLYELQRHAEERLEEIRAKEPLPKRKYERDHRIWFNLCQDVIGDLHEIRDAIVTKRAAQ